MEQAKDVGRAKETVGALEQKLQQLEADFRSETEALATKIDPLTENLEHISIRPMKKDVSVSFVALCWIPCWRSPEGKILTAVL